VAKEKEKALMKKQQREKEQQDRLAMKEKEKVLRQQELDSSALAIAVVSAKPADDSNGKVAALATSESEQAATATAAQQDASSAAAALAARKASAVSSAAAAVEKSCRDAANSTEKLDEALVKKIFQLLDRSEKNSVSKRDVLIALRKHAPVRVLFGLPAGSTGSDSDNLQARLNAIQDAFEASSGLGELSAAFEELVGAGDGSGPTFVLESLLAYCQQEAVRHRAAEALSLLPREHAVGASFEATYEWRLVPEGAACAGGLEYKMDLGGTGRTLARLARPRGWK